jgi:riboflavin biosynthesis pyrimidine reductase
MPVHGTGFIRDFDRVDQVRAESDAILIGAGTMRADNPRLARSAMAAVVGSSR